MALVVVQTSAKAAPNNPPSNVVIFGVELDMDTKFLQLPLSRNVNVWVSIVHLYSAESQASLLRCVCWVTVEEVRLK